MSARGRRTSASSRVVPAAALLALLLVAGCAPAPAIEPSPADPGGPTPAVVPSPTLVPPTPGHPPEVLLSGPGAPGTPGDLGTFSWDGLVSDSPWIVGAAAVTVRGEQELAGGSAGPVPVRSWRAAWAPLRSGTAGDPVGGDDGLGATVRLRPPGPGAWSLRLDVDYGPPGRASWYWRVEVQP